MPRWTGGRADGRTVSRREAVIASAGALAGLGLPSELAPTVTDRPSARPSVRPSARPSGRLKQSACRWPYRQIPLPDFCRAAAAMGLAAIDLLGSDEWGVVREHGLVCSMGYPAIRGDFIATGFNDRANHPLLLGELERAIIEPGGDEDPPDGRVAHRAHQAV